MESLISEMHANGLPCHNELYLDGQLHRYGKNGTNDDKDEWYIGFQNDDFIYCTYGTWSAEDKYTYMSGNIDKEKTREAEQWIAQKQEEYRQIRIKESIEAKQKASDILSHCTKKEHIYAHNKGITPNQLVTGNQMVVPYYDFDNELQTLQFIDPDGKKKFMPKGRVSGHFAILGQALVNAKKVYLCEGYATAYTVHQATNATTLCCGSLNNINAVSIVLKGLYGHIKMYLCQDVGVAADKHAAEWQKKFNGTVHKPSSNENGYDFNDLHKDSDWNIEPVKRALKVQAFPSTSIDKFFEKEYEPPKWVMENLLRESSSLLIHADGGVGKSMIALEMAIALAQGSSFIWRIEKQHKVLFIDSELPPNELQLRMINTVERRKAEFPRENFGIISCLDMMDDNLPPVNLYDQQARDMLDVTIEDYDIVFLDNMQNLTFDPECEGRENKAEFGQVITEWIKKWKSRGKCFVVVHHESKMGTARGSSRQQGDYDQIMRLEKPKNIDPNQDGFKVKLHPYKIRYAEQKHSSPKWVHLSDKHPTCTIAGKKISAETINKKFFGWLLYQEKPQNWE